MRREDTLGKLNNMAQKKYFNILKPSLSVTTEYYNKKIKFYYFRL